MLMASTNTTTTTNSTYQDLFGQQVTDETRGDVVMGKKSFEFMPRVHSFDFDSELDPNRFVYFDVNKIFTSESPISTALSSFLQQQHDEQEDAASKLDESCSSSSTATLTHTLEDQVGCGLACMESSPLTSSSEMSSSASPSSSSSSTSLTSSLSSSSSALVNGNMINTNSSLYLLKKSLAANKLSLPASASSSSECLSSCCGNYGDDEGYVGSLTDSSSASSTARSGISNVNSISGGPTQPPPPPLPPSMLTSSEATRVNESSFLFSRYFFQENTNDTESSNQMTGSMTEEKQSHSPPLPIVYSNSDEDLTGYEEDETNSDDDDDDEQEEEREENDENEQDEREEIVDFFTIPCLFQETGQDENEWPSDQLLLSKNVTTREPESFDERLWFYWSSSCLDDQFDYYSKEDVKFCVDCCNSETCELCELEQIQRELAERRESSRLETEDAMKKRDEWRRVVERLQHELATRREYAHEDSIDMNAYLNEIEMNIDYSQQLSATSGGSHDQDYDDVDDLLRFTSNATAFNLRSYHNYLMKSLLLRSNNNNSKSAKTSNNSHVVTTSGSSIREMFEKMDKIPEFVPPTSSRQHQQQQAATHDQELVMPSSQEFYLDYDASQHETTLHDDQQCDETEDLNNLNNATLVEVNNYDDEVNNNIEDEEYQYYLNEGGCAGAEFFVDGVYDEELEDQFYIDSLTEEEALSLLRNESELYAMHMAQAAKLGLLPNTGGAKSSKSKKNKSGKQKNKATTAAVTGSSAPVQTTAAKSVPETEATASSDSAVPATKKSKKSKKSKKQKKTEEEEQSQQEENTVPSTATSDDPISAETPDVESASAVVVAAVANEVIEQNIESQSTNTEQDIFETVFGVCAEDDGAKEECCDDVDSQSQQRSHQVSECDYYEEISEFGYYYKPVGVESTVSISNTMRDSLLQLRTSRRHLSRLIEANSSPSKSVSPSASASTTSSNSTGSSKKVNSTTTTTPLITIKQRSSTTAAAAAACFNKPCMYMLTDGKCMRSDCRYVHDFKTITCKYWLEGECLKGETCEFLHEHVLDGASGGVAFSFGSVCSSSTASSSGASSGSKKAKKKKKSAAATTATAAHTPAGLNRDDFNLDSEEFPALGGFANSAFPALTSAVVATTTEKPPVQQKSLPKLDHHANLSSCTKSTSTPLSQVVKSTTPSKAVNIAANKSVVVVNRGGANDKPKTSSSLSSSSSTLTSTMNSVSATSSSNANNKPTNGGSGKSTPVKK